MSGRYTPGRKKFRAYRRELRRALRVVEGYVPRWRPAEEDPREEWLELDLYCSSFFRPGGRDKKRLLAALLARTEELIRSKPAGIPFCKVILFVPGGDPARAEIILFYDPERFQTFWTRTDPADQLWLPQEGPSLLGALGLASPLPERCVLQEVRYEGGVDRERIWGFGELP